MSGDKVRGGGPSRRPLTGRCHHADTIQPLAPSEAAFLNYDFALNHSLCATWLENRNSACHRPRTSLPRRARNGKPLLNGSHTPPNWPLPSGSMAICRFEGLGT